MPGCTPDAPPLHVPSLLQPANWAKDGPFCRFYDPGYQDCQRQFKNNVIASTCIASMLGTLIMALIARMPLAVAPAMGVNAYFTYNVVGYLATKRVSYKQALAAAFVEGWIFIFITITGVRSRLVELIPKNVMYGTAAGIGCFLAFIGLQQNEGLGCVALCFACVPGCQRAAPTCSLGHA